MVLTKDEAGSSVRVIHGAEGGTEVIQVISRTQQDIQEQNISSSTEEIPMEVGE